MERCNLNSLLGWYIGRRLIEDGEEAKEGLELSRECVCTLSFSKVLGIPSELKVQRNINTVQDAKRV